jgi:hypothetical protein
MMTSYDTYKLYLAIKLHFTTNNYDFFKHNAKVNCSLNSFLKRNDRFYFHKLATKYNNEELLDYFVSNFVSDSKKWIGDLVRTDGEETYNKFKKFKESFTYNFRADCNTINLAIGDSGGNFDDMFKVVGGQHPRMLRLYLSKKISLQTMVTFDKILSFVKSWDIEIKEKVVWPDLSQQIKRYKPFITFNITKCKFIMREVFGDNT